MEQIWNVASETVFSEQPTRTEKHEIEEKEIRAAQQMWADGIVTIGRLYQQALDYRKVAVQFVQKLYGYHLGKVLFKPTLASRVQFRRTFDQALSYFVGGSVVEDRGFALRPWERVRFGEQDVIISRGTAVAMGNYYFVPVGDKEENKVEFTLGYRRDETGALCIYLHHSSLPYSTN